METQTPQLLQLSGLRQLDKNNHPIIIESFTIQGIDYHGTWISHWAEVFVLENPNRPVLQEVCAMTTHKVIIFKPFPFEAGQKIHIDGGPRGGDWEVLEVTERKVKLRCPVSFREFDWDRFCYFSEEQDGVEWPRRD